MIITLSKLVQIAIAVCLFAAPFVLWRVVLDFAARNDAAEIRTLMRWIRLFCWVAMIAAGVLLFADRLPLISIPLGGFAVGLSISVTYLKQQLEPPSPTA